MTRRFSLFVSLLLIPYPTLCQTPAIKLPSGTPLPVKIVDHFPMRVGQPIHAQLIYSVYADKALALPPKTIVTAIKPQSRQVVQFMLLIYMKWASWVKKSSSSAI